MALRCIIVFVLLCPAALAQERKITVRIVESGTEKPIRDANIAVSGTALTTFSNHLGYFETTVDRSKQTTLTISHIMYKIVEVQIPEQDRFKLYLEKDTVLLNPLNLNQYPKPAAAPEVKSNYDTLAVESEAIFPSGLEAFYTYLGNALASTLPNVTEKGFTIFFTLNETGQAVDVSISDPVENIKTSVTQVFQTMPAWIPATQRQKNVKQMFKISVNRFTPLQLQTEDLKELYSFIRKTIKYPAQAKRMGIEGPVFMQFEIDQTGHVITTQVLKGINNDCDGEVKRVISLLPSDQLKVVVSKTGQNKFILPVFYGLDNPYKDKSPFISTSNALMLPRIDIMAGGIIVQRRELGNGAATTVSGGPFYVPEPIVTTFTVLGDALRVPKNVQRLSLRNNQLSDFPKDILLLTNLNFLDLENNQLTTLPNEINVLSDLKELYLLNNKLTSLPSNFSSLKKLNTLGLTNNQFNSLPKQITLLEKLETLDLSNNQLSSIPPEIGLMKNLKVLLLINNKITNLPAELFTLKKLEKIYLNGNPINSSDIELLKKTFKKAEIGF